MLTSIPQNPEQVLFFIFHRYCLQLTPLDFHLLMDALLETLT